MLHSEENETYSPFFILLCTYSIHRHRFLALLLASIVMFAENIEGKAGSKQTGEQEHRSPSAGESAEGAECYGACQREEFTGSCGARNNQNDENHAKDRTKDGSRGKRTDAHTSCSYPASHHTVKVGAAVCQFVFDDAL